MSDLAAVSSVVHEEDFEVLLVGDEELLETVWQKVACLVILLASDLWHFLSTLHSSSSEAINTTDLSVMVRLQNSKVRNSFFGGLNSLEAELQLTSTLLYS